METFRVSFDLPLTPADVKKNLPFPFHLPPGTTQLNLELTLDPWLVDQIYNMLTLSLFDPTGFRGAGHRHSDDHRVLITRAKATPGYFPGPLPPGDWTAVVDTHLIHGGDCRARLHVWGTNEPVTGEPPVWTPHPMPARGRGWYRGDLHAHTVHSDASWELPSLLAWARHNRLDFCTLSDHNTVSGLAQMDASREPDLLTMGGMELTTFWGHALALGTRTWVDWRTRTDNTMPHIAADVMAHGYTFIIAHPRSLGDPFCTGCRWVYPEMMPGPARVVEAWNGPWREEGRNAEALPLIYSWLNAGYRLALTAGTDNHGRELEQGAVFGFNVVYADELSEIEILRAVRAGHSYLSSGPRLELTAVSGDRRVMMGDRLASVRDEPIAATVNWAGVPTGSELTWVVDGEPRETLPVEGAGTRTWTLRADRARWCHLTLRAPSGIMLALTNPIYL